MKKPTGLLAEWLWESLAKLYRAGDDGMTVQCPPLVQGRTQHLSGPARLVS